MLKVFGRSTSGKRLLREVVVITYHGFSDRGVTACLLGLFVIAVPMCVVVAGSSPSSLLGENYAAPAGEGKELIGTKPVEWTVSDWINSKPLTLESLRGKVVLVRWWTAPDCPYCSASAPALNGFWQKYREKGLVVVGMYHHKSSTTLTRKHVEEQAHELGFGFPLAIDTDWKTLRRWWLARNERRWTSVTFLVDREGVIRFIHPGGAFYKGEPGYEALERAIEEALGADGNRR